ncbi:hypothetical protein TRFO_36238 [Tritrichomonas foetus]|uniref:Uncharacterized protein n=1 Tax=Tritrichomonas foetus TaxID=1144522 RepID=A0A1J4JEG2_9EUKA|nr:hypothetical protein TRFO_36238 [Tritrichomonas foetus]|eukprot:OHS97546.1 hypothetical protein TRFO_36238 [Tritrichomonas foetus]
MENLAPFFKQLSDFPTPNDTILDKLEEFLIYSVDSQLAPIIDPLLNYICNYLHENLTANQRETVHFVNRFLSIIHMMRPTLLTTEHSKIIENALFLYLYKTNGDSQRLALIGIVDHFLTCLRNNPEKLDELSDWILNLINSSVFDINNLDIDLMLLITQVLKQIFEISKKNKTDENDETKNNENSNFENNDDFSNIEVMNLNSNLNLNININMNYISKFNDFIDAFLKLADSILSQKLTINFSQNLNILTAKILKLVARLIEQAKSISNDSLSILLKFQSMIDDSIEFSHIFQNYLLCLCFLLSFNEENRPIELLRFFTSTILKNMHLFVHPPLNRNRCIIQFIKSFAIYLNGIKKKTISNYQSIMPSVWPMIGNFHIKTTSLACNIIQSILNTEILREKKLTMEFLNQIVSAFDLLLMDFQMTDFTQSQGRAFDVDLWLDSNLQLMNLFFLVMSLDCPQKPDPIFLLIFSRLIKYAAFLIDHIGAVTHIQPVNPELSKVIFSQVLHHDFRERMLKVVDTFCKIFSLMNSSVLQPIFLENLIFILPTKKHHIYHKLMHQILLKALKDPISYFSAFFNLINLKFEEIFLPSPQPSLLDLTRFVFNEAFIQIENLSSTPSQNLSGNVNLNSQLNKNQMNSSQTGQIGSSFNGINNITNATMAAATATAAAIHTSMSNDLLKFVIKAIHAKDPMILELLLTIFHSIYPNNKPQKLTYFLNLVKQWQFSIKVALTSLSEEPKLEHLIALFALFLCPLAQVPANQIENWVNLFLPSIENDSYLFTAIRTFYNYTSRQFVQWISHFRRPIRMKIVTDLATSLPRLNGKEISYPRSLLSKVPDVTTVLSTTIDDPKPKHVYVEVYGCSLYADIFYANTLKKNQNPSENDLKILFECICYLSLNEPFFDCANSQFLNSAADYLAQKAPDMLNNEQKIIESILEKNENEEPAIYSFLFIKFRSLNKIDYDVKKPEQFIEYLAMLINSPFTTHSALLLMDELLKKMPLSNIYLRINLYLIQASLYDYDGALQVIEHHIFNRKYETPEEKKLATDIVSQYTSCVIQTTKQIRKISLKGMKYFLDQGISTSKIEYRNQLLKDLPQMATQNHYADRLEFLLLFSFKEFPDPIPFVNKLIDSLAATQLQNVVKEIQVLLKNMMFQDPACVVLSISKFIVKIIVHFLAEMPTIQTAIWEKFLTTLKGDKFKQLIPLLIKCAEKEKIIHSLPSELLNIFGTANRLPQVPCQLEEVLLVKFQVMFSPIKITPDFILWIQNMLTILSQQHSRYQVSSQLFTIMKEIHIRKSVSSTDLAKCVFLAIEITLLSHLSLIPLSERASIFVDALPEMTFHVLIDKLKKNFSMDLICLIAKLITDKRNTNFRQYCIDRMKDNISDVCLYFDEIPKNEFDCFLSFSLSNIPLLMENITESELIKIENIFLRIFVKLQNSEASQFVYKPATLLGFLEVFMPFKFVELYTENSELLGIFQNEILPLILSVPKIFHHPTFMKKFIKFMSKFPSDSLRDQIFRNIERMSTDNVHEKAFIMFIVYEYYKFFHDKEKPTLEYNVDFAAFSTKPAFPAILLNFAATSLGLLKNVTIIDAGDCKTLFLLPHSHALAIKMKLFDFSSCFTLTRLFSVTKILMTTNLECFGKDEITQSTIPFFNKTPFVARSTIRAFVTIGQLTKNYNLNNKFFKHFIFQHLTTNITTVFQTPDRYSIFYMPYIFKGLLEQEMIHDRAFELCLFCALLLLKKPIDQQFPVGQYLPSIIENLLPKINKTLIDPNLLQEIKAQLQIDQKTAISHSNDSNKQSENGNKESSTFLSPFATPSSSASIIMRLKFCIQLITTLCEVLFDINAGNWFFPECLSPSYIINSPFSRDIIPFYNKAVQACSKVDKMKTAFEITNQISSLITSISKPKVKRAPFATIAQWLNEVKGNQKEEAVILGFLEALIPMNIEQLFFTASSFEQPLNQNAISYIEKLLNREEYSNNQEFIGALKHVTSIKIMIITKSDDLMNDLYNFNWFNIHESHHLPIFLKFLFGEAFTNIINSFSELDLMTLVSLNSSKIREKYPMFHRFVLYYTKFFPKSSLARSFWSVDCNITNDPLPFHSFLENTNYLNQRNFPEDALGVLKTKIPELSTAVLFHQLSSYKAAQAFYMREMYANGNKTYFYGLNELKNVSINLSLALVPDLYEPLISKTESNTPKINLPFLSQKFGEFNKENFTSFFSQVYLTYLEHSSLWEEVYLLLDCLQKRASPSPNALLSSSLMKSLDKQHMMVSTLTWRLTIYPELKNTLLADSPTAPVTAIEEVIKKSRILLSRVLFRCGSIQSAMKQLLLAVQCKEITSIRVTPQNIPYLLSFVNSSTLPTNLPPSITLLNLNCLVALRDFKSVISLLSSVSPVNKLWLSAIVTIQQMFPDLLDLPHFFSRIQLELSSPRNENPTFYLALAINVVRNNPLAYQHFEAALLSNVKDQNKIMYLRWLPHLLYLFDNLPAEFLATLFKYQSSHFLLTVSHARYCRKVRNEVKLTEIMKKLAMTKEGRTITEFESAFRWIKMCRDDILRLCKAAQAHIKMYELLQRNETEINEELKTFCFENQPIFQTNVKLTSFCNFTGFKFPALPNPVVNVSLQADGKREAMLNLVMSKGGMRNFMLVSPRIYRYTTAEHLFMLSISKMIEHHPSSRTRSMFTFYPYVFLLHSELLMIHLSPSIVHLSPMLTQAQFGNFSRLYYNQYMNLLKTNTNSNTIPNIDNTNTAGMTNDVNNNNIDDDNDSFGGCGCVDESPRSMIERRSGIDSETNVYLNEFLQASENSKINFLFIRQNFVSHYAAYSSLRFIFGTRLPSIPNICIFGDAMKCCIPSFFEFNDQDLPQVPLTKHFVEFVPKYMINGTFATTWNSIPEVLANHQTQLIVYLKALVPDNLPLNKIERVRTRVEKMASQASEIGDKVDKIFPFEVFNHLIECSQNSLNSQPFAYAWL